MAAGKSMPPGEERGADAPPGPIPTRWVVLFYGVLAAVAVAWRLAADGVLPWSAASEVVPPPAWQRLGLGLAAGAALVAVSRAATATTEAGQRLAEELARLIGPISPQRALGFALASGLAEEALFRGALQPRVGLLAATGLFALAHYVPRPGLRSWAVFALGAGLLFGWLFEATGDLLAPATAHVVVNGVNLHWLGKDRARVA